MLAENELREASEIHVGSDVLFHQRPRSGGIFTEHTVLGFHRGEQGAGRVSNQGESIIAAGAFTAAGGLRRERHAAQ